MSDAKTLYDEDFLAWSKDQADALRTAARTGSNQHLDWENLAEEIEGLGSSQRHALHSQIQRIIHHLLKLEHSPAMEPRRRWEETVGDARSEIELLLEESPSLATEVENAVGAELTRALRRAVRDLEKYGELTPQANMTMRDDLHAHTDFGDWLPPKPHG